MSSDSTTISFFHQIILSSEPLHNRCQQAISVVPREEARQALEPVLHEHLEATTRSGAEEGEVNYRLLFCLLRKDFSGESLTDLDFSGLSLDSASFRDAQLRRVTFQDCALRAAVFDGAVLSSVNFSHCHAVASSWRYARITEVDATTPVTFDGALLTEADFTFASLKKARFLKAHMRSARLTGATIQQATFFRADLSGSQAEQINATAADFSEAVLQRAIWREANLSQTNFTEAKLAGADLTDADLTQAIGVRMDAYDACLRNIVARGADFSEATLSGADLSWAILHQTNLENARLYRADLRGTTTHGAFFGTRLAVDRDTIIPSTSHDLISMILLTAANTWEEIQFAAGVRVQRHWCWKHFARHLAQTPKLLPWAKRALTSVQSLREALAETERHSTPSVPEPAPLPPALRIEDDDHPF
jgi:uncharacterized protein YjbI with pentapeptide repeats